MNDSQTYFPLNVSNLALQNLKLVEAVQVAVAMEWWVVLVVEHSYKMNLECSQMVWIVALAQLVENLT